MSLHDRLLCLATMPAEEFKAARQLLDEMQTIQDWMYKRRRALVEDLVALENEQDEKVMRARRKRLKALRFAEEQQLALRRAA